MRGQRDFFISYNQADREWAEWIAAELESAGHSTYIQAWDFPAGTNFVLQMQEALTQSRRLVAVLSPTYVQSGFTAAEWAAVFATDPASRNRKLIPVRVKECEPQGLLGPIVYIDLVGMTRGAEARDRLIAGIGETRNKPEGGIPYPGRIRWTRWAAAAIALALAAWAYILPRAPEVYHLRIQVVPAGDARLSLSAGGELKQTAGGWEAAIPRAGLPAGGEVTVKAEQPAAFLRGERTIVLDSDPNPAVTIELQANRDARVRGNVVDEGGKSLAGVRVSVEGHAESVTTSATGHFDLPAHAADGQMIRLRARHPNGGEDTMEAQAGDVPVEFVSGHRRR